MSQPIRDVLPGMLADRGLSLRALADRISMSPSHLSRALRGEENKHLSLDALRAIADQLGVEPTHFREFRTERVVDAVRTDPALADRIFEELWIDGT